MFNRRWFEGLRLLALAALALVLALIVGHEAGVPFLVFGAVETNLHAIWGAKQSGKGSAATAPSTATTGKRLRLVIGDLAVAREDGSEAFSDMTEFSDAQDYVNTVVGSGEPGFQGTPDELAWLCWMTNAQETVTAISGPPATNEHVSVPGTGRFYGTFWKRVGSQIIERQKFVDSLLTQLQITAGTGQRVLRAVASITSLDPGVKYTVDPTLAMPGVPAFLWQEAQGTLTLGGVTFRQSTQYTLTVARPIEPIFGDAVIPQDWQPGISSVALSVAMALDQAAFDKANLIIYGTTTPGLNAKPVAFKSALEAFSVEHVQVDGTGTPTGRKAKFEVPAVMWEAPSAVVVPNPEGGGGTLELTGGARASGANPRWRSTIRCDAAAFTA
jgi:hypothetical protein